MESCDSKVLEGRWYEGPKIKGKRGVLEELKETEKRASGQLQREEPDRTRLLSHFKDLGCH